MSQENPESINESGEKFGFELFNLSPDQKQKLKDRVEKHNGLIRIFIHPDVEPIDNSEIENQQRVKDIFFKSIFSENSPPIIVFENNENIVNNPESLEKSLGTPEDVYLIPTIKDYPYPIVPGTEEPMGRDEKGQILDEDLRYIDLGFAYLVKYLNELGVKKILVGGTSLAIDGGHLTQCVGNFIEIMKEHSKVEIKLSLGTAPLNRNDIRDSHPDLI